MLRLTVNGWRGSACILLFLLTVLPRVEAGGTGSSDWIEVRSPHFSVYTDAGEKRGREVAVRFEQMRTAFGTLMQKANVNLPIPLQIVAFRSTKELRQFAPLWNGKPTEMSGLFLGGEDRSYIMLDLSVDNPWEVVFHEYAHQLMSGNLAAQVDPWFEEGFAEYFASIEVDGKEARIGKMPENTVRELAHFRLMPITDLFRVKHYSSAYNESGSTRSVFYAQSALVMHYLYDNKLLPNAIKYFDLTVNQSVPMEEAIQQSFGVPAKEFDKKLYAYFTRGQYTYYKNPTPGAIDTSTFKIAPLTQADAAAVRADIHLHSQDYQDKALAEFEEILKSDPENAAACRGLGYAYLRKQDFENAGTYFRRAAKANSQDPRVHYYSAIMMSREGQFSDPGQLAEIITELQTAITLDPSFADPYSLLGFAQTRAGDVEKGMESMRKAVQLSPRNEMYRLNLAQLCLANQKTDEAVPLLQMLVKANTPAVAARASEMLAAVQRGDLIRRQEAVRRQREATTALSRHGSSQGATTTENEVAEKPPVQKPAEPARASGSIRFLKGTVTAVDCSRKPIAVLSVVSGGRTWMLTVTDAEHVLLMGADKLSCNWTQQKVAVNYRQSGENTGNVVSVEVQ